MSAFAKTQRGGGRKKTKKSRSRRRSRTGGTWGRALRKLAVPGLLLAGNNLYRPGRVARSVRRLGKRVGVTARRRRSSRRRRRSSRRS